MTFTINIDMDTACKKCGKKGAVTNSASGYCLSCLAKEVKKKDDSEQKQRPKGR